MRSFFSVFVLTSLMSFSAFGAQEWEQELADYQTTISTATQNGLVLRMLGYSGVMAASCSASAMIVAATAITDATPVFGVVAEGLANLSDRDYETLGAEDFFSLETLADSGRGLLGGVLVGGVESFEYLFALLSGDTEGTYSEIAKVFASTISTKESLFSEKSLCVMSFTKLAMTFVELNKRDDLRGPIYFTDDEVTMP